MYTLFIDTHQNTNLALFKDNKLISHLNSNELRQSTIIMPLLKKLMEECNLNLHEINEIIVVNGPGSFTGVRLGVTIAKTIAYLLNIPTKCLNSLELKAMMDDYNNIYYGIEDTKGFYLGKNSNQEINIEYISKSEIKKENIVTDVIYDYDIIVKYFDELKTVNPHKINPLYIKKIEAQK